MLPQNMTAIVITSFGAPEVMQPQERPIEMPGDHEVLIEVKAAGVNRPDVSQRQGKYPPPPGAPQDVPGLEVSGMIVACGHKVTRWTVGDKVCALVCMLKCEQSKKLRMPASPT